MTITRVGSTAKYASGWEMAFGTTKSKKSASGAPKAAKKVAGKKAAAKKAPKKSPAKKKKS